MAVKIRAALYARVSSEKQAKEVESRGSAVAGKKRSLWSLALFGNQRPMSFRQPRFYLPLIEPDVRISRIRLSDGIRGWSPQRADKATPSPVR
jgi:hypothetical protein